MLPRSIDILGRKWSTRSKRMHNLGQCVFDDSLIEYKAGLKAQEKRDVVLHEIMHAVRFMQGHEYGEDVEENYVRSIATGLISVFDSNPKLAAWLLNKEK